MASDSKTWRIFNRPAWQAVSLMACAIVPWWFAAVQWRFAWKSNVSVSIRVPERREDGAIDWQISQHISLFLEFSDLIPPQSKCFSAWLLPCNNTVDDWYPTLDGGMDMEGYIPEHSKNHPIEIQKIIWTKPPWHWGYMLYDFRGCIGWKLIILPIFYNNRILKGRWWFP